MSTPASGASAAVPAPTPPAAPATQALPAGPAPAGVPATTPAPGTPSPLPVARRPRDLRRLRALAPFACVATGLAASGYLGASGYRTSPGDAIRQLDLVSRAQAEVRSADVDAAQLIALRRLGRTTVDRTGYDAALTRANGLLIQAADAAPATDELPQAGEGLSAYTRSVERALAAPAGSLEGAATTFRQARTQLTPTILQPLSAVTERNTNRLDGDSSGSGFPLALLVSGLSTVGLGYASWWLATKTHRIINPGLAAATLITAGLTYLAVNPSSLPGQDAGRTLASTATAATVLTNVYDARAAELTSILPGADPAALATAWTSSVRTADSNLRSGSGRLELGDAATDAWTSYQRTHDALVVATDSSERARLVESGEASLDAVVTAVRDKAGAGYRDLDANVGRPAVITAGAALASGLLAAALAWIGIGRRVEEYR